MKRVVFAIITAGVMIASGCGRSEEPTPGPQTEKVRVVLSGSIDPAEAPSRGEGIINPVNPINDGKGRPPRQLDIGILTIEDVQDLTADQINWYSPSTAYLDRGFFGGNVPGDTPEGLGTGWNGNIEYTNRSGDALQQVFYDETGVYYYLVALYPYRDIYDIENIETEDNSMILDVDKGAMVIFSLDGSQDVMSTGLGKGNIESYNGEINNLSFKHRLTCLNCMFVAESETAANLYGDIIDVKLVGQPDKIGLNIGVSAIGVADPIFDPAAANIGVDVSPIDYPAVRDTTDPLELPYLSGAAPAEFGYMLAVCARTYTFRITTEEMGAMNPFYVTYDFGEGTLPKPGTGYYLTFKMMETAEIVLEAVEPTDWWLDQTYN